MLLPLATRHGYLVTKNVPYILGLDSHPAGAIEHPLPTLVHFGPRSDETHGCDFWHPHLLVQLSSLFRRNIDTLNLRFSAWTLVLRHVAPATAGGEHSHDSALFYFERASSLKKNPSW